MRCDERTKHTHLRGHHHGASSCIALQIPDLAVQSEVVRLQSLLVGLRPLELYLKLLVERLQLDIIASRHK